MVVRETPSLCGSTSTTNGTPSSSEAVTSSRVVRPGSDANVGTPIFCPVSRSSLETGPGPRRQRPTGLVQGRSDEQRAGGDLRDERLLLLRRTAAGEGQQAAEQRLAEGQVTRAGAELADEHPDLGEAEALAAVRLGRGQAEQSGLGTGGPAGLDLLGPLVEDVGEHRADLDRHVVAHAGPFTSETVTCSSLGIRPTTATGGSCDLEGRQLRRHGGAPGQSTRTSRSPTSRSPRAAGCSCPGVDAPGSPSCPARPAPRRSCCCTRSAAPGCSPGSRWCTSSRSATASSSSTSAGTAAASSPRASRCTTAPTTSRR